VSGFQVKTRLKEAVLFCKENQKTFAYGAYVPIRIGPGVPMSKSFLVLFFKKELLPF
jgi:hypothetical protein